MSSIVIGNLALMGCIAAVVFGMLCRGYALWFSGSGNVA